MFKTKKDFLLYLLGALFYLIVLATALVGDVVRSHPDLKFSIDVQYQPTGETVEL